MVTFPHRVSRVPRVGPPRDDERAGTAIRRTGMTTSTRDQIDDLLSSANGVLRLEPTWVARDWLPPGRRLGLPPDAYDVGERGFICERWLGSTTKADNRIAPDDEGRSYLVTDDV